MRLRTLLLSTVMLLVAAVLGTVAASGPDDAPVTVPPSAEQTAAPTEPEPAPEPEPERASPSPALAPEPPAVPASRAALQERLSTVLADPLLAVSEGSVSVDIRDGYGRPVHEQMADAPRLPASTMKLVTAAAALRTFGPDHRFETSARTAVPVTGNGTVVGDLVLVGAGDPVLGTPIYGELIYPSRPRTRLEDLADEIVAAGVERITGSVVGDGTAFEGDGLARGWPDRYLSSFDARYISALTVDSGIAYDVRATEARDLIATIEPDPAALAARALWRLLVDRGVTIESGAESAALPTEAAVTVATVESAPLVDILTHMVRRSDNQVADTLFLTTGWRRTGIGTWNAGAVAARAVMGELGLDGRGTVLADGSGLSRDDRLTARLLAELDQAMARTEDADTWWRLMAVSGREGTLRRRLRGTIADGRFLGKTGTLDDTKSVVGTVFGPDERRYHLAVIANDVVGRDQRIVGVLMDELVLALEEDLFGCARGPVPAPPAPSDTTADPTASASPSPLEAPYVAPYELRCPTEVPVATDRVPPTAP